MNLVHVGAKKKKKDRLSTLLWEWRFERNTFLKPHPHEKPAEDYELLL